MFDDVIGKILFRERLHFTLIWRISSVVLCVHPNVDIEEVCQVTFAILSREIRSWRPVVYTASDREGFRDKLEVNFTTFGSRFRTLRGFAPLFPRWGKRKYICRALLHFVVFIAKKLFLIKKRVWIATKIRNFKRT